MNRPIEFRGMRADTKEWVFGNLFVPNQLLKGVFICPETTCVDFAPGFYEDSEVLSFEKASGYLGLDKREYFALHLMTALISNADRHSQEGDCQNWNYEHLSEIAIQAADALLSKLDQVQVSQ